MRPPRALPAAHFDRNESHVIYGTGHYTLWKYLRLPDRRPRFLRRQFSTKEPHEAPREPLRLHRLWFAMNNVSGTKYILGHSPAEIQRLMSQAVMLRPITERLLRSAGIEPGMRVLEVGCGAGDVSILASELVGSTGSVVGIDRNAQVLAIARERAQIAKFGQIDFKEASTGTFSDAEPFDLVVGRYVLIHQADPADLIRAAAALSRPEGLWLSMSSTFQGGSGHFPMCRFGSR